MYSKKLSKQRNKALEYRKEVKQKNPTVQAYIKYPVILMVGKGTGNKYRPERKSYKIYSRYNVKFFSKIFIVHLSC